MDVRAGLVLQLESTPAQADYYSFDSQLTPPSPRPVNRTLYDNRLTPAQQSDTSMTFDLTPMTST